MNVFISVCLLARVYTVKWRTAAIMEVLFILLFSLHLSSTDTHSLQYLYTALTPGINFPEFTAVGLVDGQQFMYYDSNIRKVIPKTEWIQKIESDNPDYWNSETSHMQSQQESFRVTVNAVMQSLNHSTGVHTLQRMYGCERGDDGTTRGYDEYGYDGEDFISLDLKTGTWTAAKPQAEILINKWDPTGDKAKYWKSYLGANCIDRLQKYMVYSRDTLGRKDPPTVSVFQKHSPPEVVCHATGFFPKTVMITWQKDREDVHEDVELRETVPNQDGSFQKRSILTVSAEDLQTHTYTCVIQHSSLEKEIVLNVSKQPSTEDTHSLQYLYTALTPGINFPEFTAVGLVDGQQFMYYDSNIKKVIPKTEWIQKMKSGNPGYWNSETSHMQSQQESFKDTVNAVMQSLNHSTGVHTLQRIYGCERDDDNTIRRYDVFGYDGEDFISLDLKTGTWTAAESPALLFIKKWESTGAEGVDQKPFLENECIDELKKFVSYGRESLERKVPPTASVFQKHSPPEVVCHATGFFPKTVMITWQKDGEDVHEDVDLGETLPNQDGSFQKRTVLTVSAEDLQKHTYTCVIQHSSMTSPPFNECPILRCGGSGGGSGGAPIGIIVGVVAALLVLIAVVAGIVVWKKKNSGFRPVPPKPDSEGDSSTNNS
ncbi:H-2 class I histocompatibility antigen, TLA(B) alpha chain isoform X2 [Ictalurus punctatus]|uniref:H-2 class I histocompatibility antigen, TLA(B) alpha chain isoform X2 n=1 Tax=Ictalurus punctatus TaxID=7998 RepID=A0A9F7QYW7_ICTPU|nr:H-2 class I histocompatibility antigen, TLA(B) alpha chain isoform X2 [Ictalurus punctatus]